MYDNAAMESKRRKGSRMVKEILTKKRCWIILIAACFIYSSLSIFIWDMNFVPAITGAICSMFVLGLFLYFIRDTSKRKELMVESEDFKQECLKSKEYEKGHIEMINRLTRDNSRLQERMKNLERVNRLLQENK